MVFLHNDFYTASGSVKLYNSWTDKVTKFDTSSFYNWEQDNLPIYDLEERTYHLWEQLGHPTSSLPGVVLVVSAGASPEYYEAYRNNFETVSAAVAALPQILNYPVIIEICNKGSLGSIELKNIKCGPKGSLEIVNKVFAKQEPEFDGSSLNSVGKQADTPYYLVSSISSLDPSLSYTVSFSARKHFQNSKSEFLNQNIFADTSLTSINNNLFGLISVISENRNARATYFLSSPAPTNSNVHAITVSPFETTSDAINNHLVNTYDVSAKDIVLDVDYITTGTQETDSGSRFIGLFYGNKFDKVLVTNSDGPIYLRNFFVDGNNITTKNEYGIEVTNSRNIFLENCICSRHTKAGFYFNNSKVIITRGIGAYRNYSTTPTRLPISGVTETNINRDYRDYAAGLHAVNSDIEFSSTATFERTKFQQDPIFSAVSSQGTLSYGLNYPINFSRNANGIILENSKLHGGVSGGSGTIFVSELNNLCGFKLFNSEIDWNGRIKARQNNIGLLSVNSNLILDRASFVENTLEGLRLLNSNLIYNKNSILHNGSEAQYAFNKNGKHLHLINSTYIFNKTINIPSFLGLHKFENCNSKSILIEDSSKCSLVHPFVRSRDISETSVKYGDPISVENNSKLTLKGSKETAVTVIGRPTEGNQKNSAGVYAVNNSVVDIQGPTVIAQYSVDVLVDNNSVLNITPHRDDAGNKLQITEFALSDSGNHTMVELHSTRSCLVADRNSIINIENLGDFSSCWARGINGSEALTFGPDYKIDSIKDFIQGGFIQFYPNTNVNHNVIGGGPNDAFSPTSIGGLSTHYYLFDRDEAFQNYSGVTYGGMCVRALNNSFVNVKNVNFPAGHWNPSGIFYNSSGVNSLAKLCSLLFIWNIADDSKLHASYCSVSSMYPADVGYFGPPAVWLEALNEFGTMSGNPLQSMPPLSGDAYVSSYSLLDFFGSGPSGTSGIFQPSSFNQGPFRLYFSVDPAINHLKLLTTNPYSQILSGAYFSGGWIPQVYSQGYYIPLYMSAAPSVSSLHKTLFRFSPVGTLPNRSSFLSGLYLATGYNEPLNGLLAYYPTILGAGMLHNALSPRVFVDESASNLFANAKHCATGKSGAPKIVSIYYPYTSNLGEANYNNKDVGIGIGSVNFFDLSRDI